MRYFSCFLLILFTVSAACSGDRQSQSDSRGRDLEYPATVIFLDSRNQPVASLKAAVADDNASRSTGLMEVYEMPMDHGMLFIFPDEEPRSFWMANTPLALDIIFADSDGKIVRIRQNTRPYSDRNILSDVPAMYVVETNAGYVLQHDILEGMKIRIEREATQEGSDSG